MFYFLPFSVSYFFISESSFISQSVVLRIGALYNVTLCDCLSGTVRVDSVQYIVLQGLAA